MVWGSEAAAHGRLADLPVKKCRIRIGWVAALTGVWLLVSTPRSSASVDYLREIKPLLKVRCYSCHGALKQKGDLRLDTLDSLRKGGLHGTPLGMPNPLLLARVSNPDETERMPQDGSALSKEQIGKLAEWVSEGAPGPSAEEPDPDPRAHWAFKSPQRALLPKNDSAARPPTIIDSLIASRHASRGLIPQAEMPRELWLRRVYLDTVGLPPTVRQIEEFQNDTSAVSHSQVIDRLLSSPEFGERWARHLMDLWRYSDWWGLDAQLRYSQKHIWHWRDWIVESLNSGKGYDRMIVEMLAADELDPENQDALRATGFLCRSYYLFNRTTWLDEVVEHTSRAFLGLTMQCAKCHDHKYDPLEQADYYRMRAVFEPYHVRVDAWPGEPDFEKNGLPRAFDLNLNIPTHIHRRGDDRQPDTNRVIHPGMPVLFGELEVKPVVLPISAHSPGLRRYVLEDQVRAAENQIAEERVGLKQAKGRLEALVSQNKKEKPNVLATASPSAAEDPLADANAAVKVFERRLEAAEIKPIALRASWAADAWKQGLEKFWTLPGVHMPLEPEGWVREAALADARLRLAQTQANLAAAEKELATAPKEKQNDIQKRLKTAREVIEKESKRVENPDTHYRSSSGALKALVGPEDNFDKNPSFYPVQSTGRRLALARWIANRKNPLAARVFVNHVWTRIFAESMVGDVSDWGRRAAPPLHQDVLDTLAVEFVDNGWELKHLLRVMLNSRLYRLGSTSKGADPATLAADPENKTYWRMNSKRLDSQVIRDGLLFASGLLERDVGGPSVPVPSGENSHRRALYFQQHGELEHRFLAAFDNSNVFECYRRPESVTPQQALAMANSKLTRECAEALEKRLASDLVMRREFGGAKRPADAEVDRQFTRAAFMTLLARSPNPGEEEACLESLARLGPVLFSDVEAARARVLFLQALMNHNDFVTLR